MKRSDLEFLKSELWYIYLDKYNKYEGFQQLKS